MDGNVFFGSGTGFSRSHAQVANGDDASRRRVKRQQPLPEDLRLVSRTDLSDSNSHAAALQLIGRWQRG